MLRRIILALICVVCPLLANAQQVQQQGTVSPYHLPSWVTSGTIRDGGTPSNPYVNSLGIYGSGGIPFAVDSVSNPGPISNSTQYCEFGMGASNSGGATFYVLPKNGLSSCPLNFNINGSVYPFPFATGGNVLGPSTSTVGDFAVWNNTTGTLLADQSPGTFNGLVTVVTASGAITVTTSQKIIVVNKGTPAATSVVLPAASNWPNCPTLTNSCPLYRIKDGAGNASSYPITITTADSTTIDGQTSSVMSSNYAEIDYLLIGTTWIAL